MEPPSKKVKVTGRAFYESIGSPKFVVAPMVDRSEFAWRKLTRSFMPTSSKPILAYTPMMHSRLFGEQFKMRETHFQPTRTGLRDLEEAKRDKPWLDGNPSTDRPLIVQFCANDPDVLLEAARYVEPYCDAVDLNLGCPQGIARKGNYGAFLQEDWGLIYRLINKLHKELSVPVSAKFRILDTREKTLEYAKMILSAGASIITVHGRRREQKSQNSGIADWSMIRFLRDNLPPDTVIFSNGNILNHSDMDNCLETTGADAIMSAEGNLSDPTLFSEPPPIGKEGREYWRSRDGRGGYRIDAVLRRYLDIIYRDVLEQEPPVRGPLFIPGNTEDVRTEPGKSKIESREDEEGPQRKKQKCEKESKVTSPNLRYLQGHLFQMFRPFIGTYTHIRDALSKARPGDLPAFEHVLALLEKQVEEALLEEAQSDQGSQSAATTSRVDTNSDDPDLTPGQKAYRETIAKYKRPWFICQPHIRPLPEEAVRKGALQPRKKDSARMVKEDEPRTKSTSAANGLNPGLQASGVADDITESIKSELPAEAIVCG